MVNYQNGKIYWIKSKTSGLCYIGSTCSPLKKRLSIHKTNKKNLCQSKHIINSGEPYEIKLLEILPCNSRRELAKRERLWYDIIPNINRFRPYISPEEKKQLFLDNSRKWSDNNRERQNKSKYKYFVKNRNSINMRRNFQNTQFGKLCRRYSAFKV